jgi:tetratricopeptide (TPR) repeat protein
MERRLARFPLLVVLSAWLLPVSYADTTSSMSVMGTNQYLSEGATAIRMGSFEEGIRLTEKGLKTTISKSDHAAGLANLCGAYVGLLEPDQAIGFCNQSLEINNHNWKTYCNRAAAFAIKGLYSEATFDLDAASAINPSARNVELLRQFLNELRLRPKVIMEEHQPTSLFSE